MALIRLTTLIHAPMEKVFDLSRSVDLHLSAAAYTQEEAIAGKTSGLLSLGESVTWRARHLGRTRTLTVKVTAYDHPHMFEDCMVQGDFAMMRHIHRFRQEGEITRMEDEFEFRSPYGIVGRLFDALYLKGYMTRFLMKRNAHLKQVAEEE